MEVIGNYEELSDNVMLNFPKTGNHFHDEETVQMETCSPAIERVDLTDVASSHQPLVN